MNKYKDGDVLVCIVPHYNPMGYFTTNKKYTVRHIYDHMYIFINGDISFFTDQDKFVPENVYNSPLYLIMREE